MSVETPKNWPTYLDSPKPEESLYYSGKWHKYSEEKPTKDGKYIIYYKFAGRSDYDMIRYYNNYGWCEFEERYILYWTECPTAP